jgi:hypothetical protein
MVVILLREGRWLVRQFSRPALAVQDLSTHKPELWPEGEGSHQLAIAFLLLEQEDGVIPEAESVVPGKWVKWTLLGGGRSVWNWDGWGEESIVSPNGTGQHDPSPRYGRNRLPRYLRLGCGEVGM